VVKASDIEAPAELEILNPDLEIGVEDLQLDRKSTRLNSSHRTISYAVFCLKKKMPGDQLVIALRQARQRERAVLGAERGRRARHRVLIVSASRDGGSPVPPAPPRDGHAVSRHRPATTPIYPLSLHDALPISWSRRPTSRRRPSWRSSTPISRSGLRISS